MANQQTKNAHADSQGEHHDLYHVTPLATYFKVAGALFALTFLTVICHNMHLGVLKAPVAFLIATVKAVLVMLWFMHLKDENKGNRVIFFSGFFFLVLLYFFCDLDILTRFVETSTL